MELLFILLALAGGFVAGILVGRKNKQGVEKELQAIKDKFGVK